MSNYYRGIPNTFRADLIAGKRLIGCWCSLASPITAEVLGVAGFDWLLLDGEHSPNDLTTMIPQLMAWKDSISAPIVRPPVNEPVIIKRLLDAGFYNFLIPMIETVEQARQAVAATRYPPVGIRGLSVSQRHNRYGTVPDYFATVNDHIAVIVQIESREGVAAVDEIAAVPGVDAIFIGPGDLSAALGYIGQPNHPEVQSVIAHLIARTKAAGKPCGILAPAEVDARRYLEWGTTMVGVGSDLGVFRNATQALRNTYRD